MKTFCLPDLGEGLQEAEVVTWHVSRGDRVVADQPLLAVETDKAVVDIPAPWSGIVTDLFVDAGDIVATGAPVASFDLGAEQKDPGAIVGALPEAEARAETGAVGPPAAAGRVKAVPAVRKRARELGVDLETVTPGGPGGSVRLEDVERAAGSRAARSAGARWQPLRGVRRAMARNMERAHATVAAATVTDEADVSCWPPHNDVTVALMRAIAAAAEAQPALNAWYDPRAEARLLHDRIDLGLAVSTSDGLFVPVIRNIAGRSRADLAAALEELKRDVTARAVPKAQLEGQTITLSNFGVAGGRHAALMIVPPQVAILGAGRIRTEPRVIDGQIRAAPVLPLSLTFDHRAVTGIEATRFLMAAIKFLENDRENEDDNG